MNGFAETASGAGIRRRGQAIEATTFNFRKETIMKQSRKFALAVIASVGLGVAAAAYAQQGSMGGGMGHDGQGGTQQGGMMGGMGPGGTGGMQQGGMMGGMGGGMTGHGAAQQLMTPEERTALMEKIHDARTPEERQQIAAAARTEMQKRAREKGITLPEHHGPRFGATPQAPADTGQPN